MKLLMITQRIDKNDDILGVYHEWAREIAKDFEKLSVICLYEGLNELPSNIRVFSLGKESNANARGLERGFMRIKYLLKFYSVIWKERNNYDVVFVHMTPIYITLGFVIWRVLKKKIFFWYAHPAWNWKVKVAYVLSDKVITSVPEAFNVRGEKVVAVGQGIDTERFGVRTDIQRDKKAILFLGRISPSKHIDILLSAMKILTEKGYEIPILHIVGDPPEELNHVKYFHKLLEFAKNNNLENKITFHKAVPNIKAFEWYNKCGIFVNLSPVGHFDKTVLEAMACECLTIVSNEAYRNVFPQDLHDLLIFEQDNVEDLAKKIQKTLELPLDRRNVIGKRLRGVVMQDHSIITFGKRLRVVFQTDKI